MAEAQRSVFLSYARADDEPFVERLYGDLIQAGIEVWWDRAAMESRGRTFLQEIRDAIEGVDRSSPARPTAASTSSKSASPSCPRMPTSRLRRGRT